jgi:hypothetical protein
VHKGGQHPLLRDSSTPLGAFQFLIEWDNVGVSDYSVADIFKISIMLYKVSIILQLLKEHQYPVKKNVNLNTI